MQGSNMQPWEAPDLNTAVSMLAKKAALMRRIKKADISSLGNTALQTLQSTYANRPMLTAGLTGAGIGGLAGGLSSLMSPRKERRRPFSDALTGALAGGAVGLGAQTLRQNSPVIQKWLGDLRSKGEAQQAYSKARGMIPEAIDRLTGKGPYADIPTEEAPGGLANKALLGTPETSRKVVAPFFGSRAGDVASVAWPATGVAATLDAGRGMYRKLNPLAHGNLRSGAGAWLQDKDMLSNTASLLPDTAVSPTLPEAPAKTRVQLNSSGQPTAASVAELEKARIARNAYAKEVKDLYAKTKTDRLSELLTKLHVAKGRGATNTAVSELSQVLPATQRAGILSRIGEAGQAVPASSSIRRARLGGYGLGALLPLIAGLVAKPPQSPYLSETTSNAR